MRHLYMIVTLLLGYKEGAGCKIQLLR